ncbi:MAG: class I tRNA ligase family protein, partial [Oscillospiraceae bacterium]|nr:class I tRNA ligase family protein [Oscillospiraceae bacterium]
EMQEQVRLWFYSQLFMSVTITGKAPYEKVQTHARVIQEDGSEFHKTGFMIRFEEAADKMGADVIRYLYAGAPTSSDVRFGFTLGEEARRKLLGFWNIYTFFMTYAEIDKPKIQQGASGNLTDRWLESRVAAFAAKAKKGYENFNTPEIVREFEQCADDVSNWYVRINRRRFWKEGSDADKGGAYNALYFAIKQISQVMAPILPFMTEHIWQNMVLVYEKAEESIHLSAFPETKEYDGLILEQAEKVRAIIAQALKLRNEQNLKVRQPLSVLYLGKSFETVSVYDAVIRDELNIREIAYLDDFAVLAREYPALNFQTAGRQLKAELSKVKALCENLSEDEKERIVERLKNGLPVTLEGYEGDIPANCFNILSKDRENIAKASDGALVAVNTEITPKLKAEGIYREVLRHCQLLRKEAGFEVVDRVTLCFETESEAVKAVLETYAGEIAKETLSEIRDIPEPVMRKEVGLDEGTMTLSIGR